MWKFTGALLCFQYHLPFPCVVLQPCSFVCWFRKFCIHVDSQTPDFHLFIAFFFPDDFNWGSRYTFHSKHLSINLALENCRPFWNSHLSHLLLPSVSWCDPQSASEIMWSSFLYFFWSDGRIYHCPDAQCLLRGGHFLQPPLSASKTKSILFFPTNLGC